MRKLYERSSTPASAHFRRNSLALLLGAMFLLHTDVFPQVVNPTQAGVIEQGFGVIPNLTGATAVDVKGNYAYVVGIGDALEILDITLPGLPVHKGILLNGQGGASILRPQKIMVQGNYAYISSYGGDAFEIVDVSDPAHPVHKSVLRDGRGNVPLLEGAWGFDIAGNYAYVASTDALEIIDISNPAAPVHKSSVLNVGDPDGPYMLQPVSVTLHGNIAYVGTTAGSIEIIDVSNPAAPIQVGRVLDGGGVPPFLASAYNIRIRGNYAYVPSWSQKSVEVLDISNPIAPVHAGSIVAGATSNTPPLLYGAWDIAFSGDYGFVTGSGTSFEVINISDPTNPTHVTGFKDDFLGIGRIIKVVGNYVYVPSRSTGSLSLIDISNPEAPTFKSTTTTPVGGALLENATALVLDGDYAYVANNSFGPEGTVGFEIVNVSKPSLPTHTGSLRYGSGNYQYLMTDVVKANNLVYTAGSDFITIIDVSFPTAPVQKGTFYCEDPTPPADPMDNVTANTTGIALNPDAPYFVYVTNYNYDALEAINVVDPTNPIHADYLIDGAVASPGVSPNLKKPTSIIVERVGPNMTGYVTSLGSDALTLLDMQFPLAYRSSIVDGEGGALLKKPKHMFKVGNLAYVASYGSSALEIVDVSNIFAPVHKGALQSPLLDSINHVFVSGNYAYVTCAQTVPGQTGVPERGRMVVIDVSDPTNPLYYGTFTNGTGGALLDYPTSVTVRDGYAYVTNAGLFWALNTIYLYGPSISSFSPLSASVGSTVTVTGTNFNTFVTGQINGQEAEVVQVTENEITLKVPSGATTGQISLKLEGQAFNSGANFLIVPQATQPTNLGQTSFKATWSDVGTSNYFLSVSEDDFVTKVPGYDSLPVSATIQEVAGLTPGTAYKFRVRSSDGIFVSDTSNWYTVTTIPATPTTHPASSVTQSSFNISWDQVPGATGYFLDVATDVNFTNFLTGLNNLPVSANTQAVSGAASGTNHYFRVRSVNGSGTSPSSIVGTVLTIPGNVDAQAASAISTTEFTANWTASAGTTDYRFDVSTDNFSTFVNGYDSVAVGTVLTQTLSGLTSGTTYQYRVRATNASGTSGNSDVISLITLPADPALQSATAVSQNSFTVTWSPVLGSAYYGVDVATDAAFDALIYDNIKVTTQTSYTAGSLIPGTTYYVRARANNASGSSNNSNVISATTYAQLPTTQSSGITFTGVNTTSITLSFTQGNGASHLVLVNQNAPLAEIPVNGIGYVANTVFGDGDAIGSGFVVSTGVGPVTVTGLSPASIYYFHVYEFNGSAGTENYNSLPAVNNPRSTTTLTTPPVSSAATLISQSGFTANWAEVTGAAGYELDVSTDDFATLLVGYNALTVSNTFYSVTGLNGGTVYKYRVRGKNAGGASANSNVITVLTIPANSNALAATAVTDNSFTANWTSSMGADEYLLDVATDATFADIIPGYNGLSVSVTSQAVTGLDPATLHYYRVRTSNATGLSGNSVTISALTQPVAPVATAATSITQTSFVANWNAVAGATGYFIDVATDAGFASILSSYNNLSITANSLQVSNLSSGSPHYYRVRAGNESGSTASSPAVPVLTVPGNVDPDDASGWTENSFQANWNSSFGADGYLVDVATDPSFNSILTGYQNLLVTSTFKEVTGLDAGTSYYYRVQAKNATGQSFESPVTATITLPEAPVANEATAVTQSDFTISWSSVKSATSYNIDIADDQEFLSVRYNNVSVNSTSYNTGSLSLDDEKTYYVRVSAKNDSGSGEDSDFISVTLLAALPVNQQSTALSFSAVSSTSVTVNFTTSNSSSSHLVVVSANTPLNTTPQNGTSYTAVSAFGQGSSLGNGVVVSSTSTGPIVVTGLSPATIYYFQVFDFAGSGGTENYLTTTSFNNPAAQTTFANSPTSQPTNLTFTAATGTSVNISFTAAAGAPTGYLALRSADSAPTAVPVNGNVYSIGSTLGDAKVAYVGLSVLFPDAALPTGETYFYQIFSFNGTGATTSYYTVDPLEDDVTLDVESPIISSPTPPNPTTITAGFTQTFNAVITDNVGVAQKKIFYRGIAETTPFNSTDMIPSGVAGTYSVQIQTEWCDEFGLEYYFWAADANGNESVPPANNNLMQLINASLPVPELPSGQDESSYRIITFPYKLATDNKVTSVYPGVPWANNDESGLWRWDPTLNNGEGYYERYGRDPAFETMDPGKGYWMIVATAISPQLPGVYAPKYDKEHRFPMTLKPRWNAIGNPYPVPISWEDVIAFNPNASISPLSVFNGTGYDVQSELGPFEGGFVKNLGSADITIQIPFPGQVDGGRRAPIGSDISRDNWNILIDISQGDMVNRLGGFGMHSSANSGTDPFDNFNPPRFLDVPEINFVNREFPGVAFSNDMVKTGDSYTWEFTASGREGEVAVLKWNDNITTGNYAQLFLLDESAIRLVDMLAESSYEFIIGKNDRFRIFYGDNIQKKIAPLQVAAGNPHPNPLNGEGRTAISVALPDRDGDYNIQMQIYDIRGMSIQELTGTFQPGIHEVDMTFEQSVPSGMYLYRMSISSKDSSSVFTGKIVKP